MAKLKLCLPVIFLLVISQSCTTKEAASQPGSQKSLLPKNVILMIGDGMGLTQITAGMIANNNYLHLERCSFIGLAKTSSTSKLITDSAAGATALASGVKTYNGAIGVDPEKKRVPTLLEIAEERNLSTGIVTSSSITHATPASFYAHQPSRKMNEEIAEDLVKSGVDVFMGGGKQYFNKRTDNQDLIKGLKSKEYSIYNSLSEVEDGKKIGVFIADDQPQSVIAGRADFLPLATEKNN